MTCLVDRRNILATVEKITAGRKLRDDHDRHNYTKALNSLQTAVIAVSVALLAP